MPPAPLRKKHFYSDRETIRSLDGRNAVIVFNLILHVQCVMHMASGLQPVTVGTI
jgi:hypothetical protein